jgi:predicted Zn-dependent protease with MMP-like domain
VRQNHPPTPAPARRPVTIAPSIDDIERLAADAFKTIPEVLASRLDDVLIRVTDFPDAETEHEMGLESPFDLLGLYVGVAMTERGANDAQGEPDMIFLYRRPLLDYWCETGDSLPDLVRHVLIHEIGHHFGFSDTDMARIEGTP